MARLLFVIGQSNATAIGDTKTWEDENPTLALRDQSLDSAVRRTFSQGSSSDRYAIPGSFPGQFQAGQLGTTTFGSYQTPDYSGVGYSGIRNITFYNPSASFLTFDGNALDYPGRAKIDAIAGDPTPSRFYSRSVHWHRHSEVTGAVTAVGGGGSDTFTVASDHTIPAGALVAAQLTSGTYPEGLSGTQVYEVIGSPGSTTLQLQKWPSGDAVFVDGSTDWSTNVVAFHRCEIGTITREKTQTQHTAAFGAATSSGGGRYCISVDPPFLPAPEPGEVFTYPIVLGASTGASPRNPPAAAGPMLLRNRFGGLFDVGDLGTTWRSSYGTIDTFTGGEVIATVGAAWDDVADEVTITGHPFDTGDKVQLRPGPTASLPSELAFGRTYYVKNESANTISLWADPATTATQVVWSAGLGAADQMNLVRAVPAPVRVTCTATAYYPQEALRFGPSGLVATVLASAAPYYVTRRTEPVETLTIDLDTYPAEASTNRLVAGPLETTNQAGTPHQLVTWERVQLSSTGALPTGLTAGTIYYVKQTDFARKFELYTDDALTAQATFSDTGSGVLTVTRLDSYCSFYVTLTPGGDEVSTIDVTNSPLGAYQYGAPNNALVQTTTTRAERYAGSLAGLRIRCTNGVNLGESLMLTHVTYDNTDQVGLVHHDGSWTNTPAAGDQFVIEVPPVNGEEWPISKWCKPLPWCPFEGYVHASGVFNATSLATGEGVELAVNGAGLYYGDVLRFYTTGTLPNGLVVGKNYYVTETGGISAFFSDSRDGSNLTGSASPGGSGTHYYQILSQIDRYNPAPPGFNYPNHKYPLGLYQPFSARRIAGSEGSSFAMTMAALMQQYHGEPIYVCYAAVSGSSLGKKEVSALPTTSDGVGGYDPNKQIDWSPGDPNNCFGRFEEMVDGIRIMAAEAGITFTDATFAWAQGEEDARFLDMSNAYEANLISLKARLRAVVKAAGLHAGSEESIRFLQPTIQEISNWPYATTVNAAIQAAAEADPYSRHVTGTDLLVRSAVLPLDSDDVHYAGSTMHLLGERLFDAYKSLERTGPTEVEVCNYALANIGESASVTSIDPPDGSREAALCAQFFDLARDTLLERHAWDFAIRTKTLTVRAASPRADWKYAYDYPSNVASVLAILDPNATYDYRTMGTTAPQDYTVELDVNGDRVLMTDQKDAVLVYVAKVTDPARWSSTFVKALSWQLSAYLAGPILKGEEGLKMVEMAEAMALRTFRTATKHDSDHKRQVDRSDHVPVWLRHRANPRYRS